jgi:hypothetical protein
VAPLSCHGQPISYTQTSPTMTSCQFGAHAYHTEYASLDRYSRSTNSIPGRSSLTRPSSSAIDAPLRGYTNRSRAHVLQVPVRKGTREQDRATNISFGHNDLWSRSRHHILFNDSCPFAMISVMWRIWDARNSLIFRQQSIPCNLVISRIIEDISLLSHMTKISDHKAQMML